MYYPATANVRVEATACIIKENVQKQVAFKSLICLSFGFGHTGGVIGIISVVLNFNCRRFE